MTHASSESVGRADDGAGVEVEVELEAGGRATRDTHVTVHLWLEQSTDDLRARLRSPVLTTEPVAAGLTDIQSMISDAVVAASSALGGGGR